MTKPFCPARRGDLAVTLKQTRYRNIMVGAYSGYNTIKVGLVTSVTCSGAVKVVDLGETCCPQKPRDWDTIWIISQDKMDMPRAMDLVGDVFDSVNGARDALRLVKV